MDKEYHRQKAREHYQKYKKQYNDRCAVQRDRTRQLVLEAKSGGCVACPEKDPVCLDFHHLHGKDKSISQMNGMNDERVRREIAKCVVLCANCHRKHHAGTIKIDVE